MSSKRNVSWPLAALAIAGLSAVGCGGESAPPAGAGAAPPPEVAVFTVQPSRAVLSAELPGRTVPYLVAEIRPQVNGILRERRFEEGANVKAGDLLYQIDPTPYQAAFNQAQAALAVAEAGLPAMRTRVKRLEQLVEIDAAGQQDRDDAQAALLQAEANVASAKAAIETARVNLSFTPLRAPISGRIGKSTITPGALVTAYQPVPLTTITQLDPVYVDVTQSSADLLALRRRLTSGDLKQSENQKKNVRLLLEDGTPYPQTGTLRFRDVTVDPTTGSVSLRMVFPNPDHVLLPGMFVRAIVEDAVDENALLVPQQAVTRDSKGRATTLAVTAENKVELRLLTIDREVGHTWLVTQGVSPGDRLIVEGSQRVRPGGAVTPVPFTGAATASAPGSSATPSASPQVARPAAAASGTPGAGK
jgi:membrane fusion protein (multidrug efflux system)